MNEHLPERARAIIVGGGIVGCSVAYHLAELGWRDTLLVEQNRLAGGTTWHAAGQVGRLRVSRNMTEVNKYSAELFARLEAETGLPTGWAATGSLMVAASEDRLVQLQRTVAMAELFGIEASIVGRGFVADKWPQMYIDDLQGAAWIPGDGKVHPEKATLSLAAGARQRGVRIAEGVRVLGLLRKGRRVVGVRCEQGSIEAEVVILCGGMWARQLGLACGFDIPLYPVEHHYVQTEPLDGVSDDLPMIRDPDAMIYVRPDGNTLLLGGFQAISKPWLVDRVPDDFAFQLLPDDWPKFADPLAAGKHRLPFLESAKFPRFVNGPESFTPDNNFLLGPPAGVDGCYIAAGFNSAGIACSGGVGKLLAEWIDGGESPCDLWSVDPRRFATPSNETAFLRERVGEVLGWHYAMAWPNREPVTGRNLFRSPLFERQQSAGACFGQKQGWERPNFFASPGESPTLRYSWHRQNWFAYSAREHHAVRSQVGIVEQTSFGKLLLEGPQALSALQWLCANNIDVPEGTSVYTPMLNARGRFESDLTVTRIAADRFYLVTSTAQIVHDRDWIERNLCGRVGARLSDVTHDYGVLGVMGPQSRALLAPLVDAPLDNERFPFGSARNIRVGNARLWAIRVSYAGELGWELHIPIADLASVYDLLWNAGKAFGLANVGHYAINSLRLEKGYCAWGVDISPDETPREAGMGFVVDLKKDFLGRVALQAARLRPPSKRRLNFVLSDAGPTLWGNEPIWRDGRKVGYTTSAAFGHTLGGAVAMGYIPLAEEDRPANLLESTYEIETAGLRCPAKPFLKAPYDPEGNRLRSGAVPVGSSSGQLQQLALATGTGS
jgi:4-methylaminobutanoate oxidase (formaldehyde-forming)